MAKTNNAESKIFVAPKSNLELSATDRLYLGLTRRSSGGLTFIYTLVSRRDEWGRYPILTETNVVAFKNSAKADIYYKTVLDIMRWQSASYLQTVRKYFRDNAVNFYKRNR